MAQSQGPAHRATIEAWLRAAHCCMQCGEPDDAARSLRTAVHAILRHPESPDPALPDIPDIMDLYAATLDEARRSRHADRVRARAQSLRRRPAGPN